MEEKLDPFIRVSLPRWALGPLENFRKSTRAHVGGGMARWWEFSPTPLVEESLDPFIRVSLPHAIGE